MFCARFKSTEQTEDSDESSKGLMALYYINIGLIIFEVAYIILPFISIPLVAAIVQSKFCNVFSVKKPKKYEMKNETEQDLNTTNIQEREFN